MIDAYSPLNHQWWLQDESELYKTVYSYVKVLDQSQVYRQDDNFRHMRLYGNVESFSLRNFNFFRAEQSYSTQNRVTLNVIQSMVDTVVSKITKNKPRPTFLTEGGDWSLQRKAKKLTQFVDGQFVATDFYQLAALAFQDSCIFGSGAVKIFKDGLDLKAERVFIDEIIVDDAESLYGQPRQMHQRKWIHKDILKEMFPDKVVQIDMAGSNEFSTYGSNMYDRKTNMMLVLESWHLPSDKTGKDGKHTICIPSCCLFTEPYEKSYFPFVFWRWNLRPLGFFGQGLAEQLSGIQLEINKILRTIQVSMHLVSVPKIFVEASSKIVSSHLNNKVGGIIKYVGQPPTPGQLGSIPPELFAHLDRLYSRAFEIAGVSQLSAAAAKPAGLNSGKALREYNDLESERFMAVAQRYEKTFLDAAKIFIDLAKDIQAEGGDYSVKVKGNKFLETIKWSQVALDEDMYLMQCFPTSALSNTPAGRLQDIQELLQAGFISKEDGMKLLDFPDLQRFYNFNNAGIEDIERAIELIIDDGNYQTPEPYQNLSLGITKFQQAYLYYRANNAPEERLELLRRWIEDAAALLQKAQQAAQPPAPEMPPAPPQPGISDAIEAQATIPEAPIPQ